MVNKLKLIHFDTLQKTNSEQWYTSLSTDLDSDTAVAVWNWARDVVNLTTDVYKDVEISSVQSINEKIAEGGEDNG